MGIVSTIFVAYYPVRITNTPYDLVFCIPIFFTFLMDLSLLLLTSYLLRRPSERHYITAKILIHTTFVFKVLTSVSMLLLLNPRYAVVTIVALLVTMAIVFCNGINGGQASTDCSYEDLQSELKQFFDLSASVTGAALAGLVASIFGYFKNFSKDVDQELVDVKFSEAFMFFTAICGLLAMLLTTVPPSVPHPNARSRYITFIKVLIYSLLGLVALIVLAVAAQFLRQYIFLAFLPIFLAVVVWFRKEFISQEDGTSRDQGATGHESEPEASSIPRAITTLIFAAFMVVYSLNFGSEGNAGFHLKACMLFMSLAFMSSLSWMAIRSPRTQSLAKAVTVLTYSTGFWSVIAFLDLIFSRIQSGN